ncbi:MAG: molecular chaperone HtpG [Myxococcota bacterium]|nr:molecular chaperone HtpG [Myxococcota bacterium]
MPARTKSTRKFKAEVSRVLQLVVNSLYSNKQIFLRELVSNASDAIDKVKLLALTEDVLSDEEGEQAIRLHADAETGTITIEDDGIGMSRDELAENLGTLAHSGTTEFLEKLTEGSSTQLIGQFGVGFYSAFLVADRVDVTSKPPGKDAEAWTWSSDADDSYTLSPAERATRGTTIVLHIKEDQKELLDAWQLRSLIERYSDYVSHPIYLKTPTYGEDGEPSSEVAQVNKANALWQRPADEIDEEQYAEFYRHLTHDWNEPLTRTHFRIEGTQLFTGLLFVPSNPPMDLFMREHRRGVRLFVKRVFIMDDAEDLVPVWLRFIKGVIDSDDLPLNVSREILQDSAIVRTIRKQIVKKTLDSLNTLAKEDGEKYTSFWNHFGAVLKEGLHMDPEHKGRLTPLLRYTSSKAEGLTSLAEYKERMPEGQGAIYYALGESETALRGSPWLETLESRGYEVIFMTDPIDEWAVTNLGDYEDLPLVSAMKADLGLEESEEETKKREARSEELQPLLDRFASILGDRVEEVKLSSRLTDSPCCLVVPEGGRHAYLERLLKSQDQGAGPSRRVLEINSGHALIENLARLIELEPESEAVVPWIETLYDQVLLTEGSPVADPNLLARRMTELMCQATEAALQR